MRYWLRVNKENLGPYSADELRRQQGLSAMTLVCPEAARGSSDWKRLMDVPELRGVLDLSAPASPPPPPASLEAAKVPSESGDSGVVALGAFILTWGNVAWQVWMVIVTNAPGANLKETFIVYAFLMLVPALSMVIINSAARQRAAKTGSLGSLGVLTTVSATISWIVFIVMGLWCSLLYAGVTGGGS